MHQPETQSGVDTCPRPFKGVVVCATGILDKPNLFTKAMKLGSLALPAFTDIVTHLIASDHGGAKYACALDRMVPIMKPSWITACHDIWLKGDDVDFNASVEEHRLPVFSDVVIALSGIDDLQRRTRINKLTTHLGGTYVKSIERPVRVTHLLCAGDTETEKMQYAEKFNKHGEAHIHLVWEEWFWDSAEFGGRFDETRYRVDLPRPERRAIPELPTPAPPAPKPPPAPFASNLPSALHELNSENLEEEEEAASVKRVPALTLRLWERLLKPRGFEIAGGALVRSPSKDKGVSQAQQDGDMPPSPLAPKRRLPEDDERDTGGIGSVIASFKRTNSFVQPAPAHASVPRQPFRRAISTSVVAGHEYTHPPATRTHSAPMDTGDNGAEAGPSSQGGSSSSSRYLFAGLTFRGLGEARSPIVRTEIEGCGGRMVSDAEPDENVDFVLVRLVSGSKLYLDEPDSAERAKYRTECWLERCVFEERICAADEHVVFTPLTIQTPVAGADKINLSFSGLDQSEACWTRRLLRALGANIAPNFSRRSTHLLCPSGTGAKFEKAREWHIPVVHMEWLAAMARTGDVGPAAYYGVGAVEVEDDVDMAMNADFIIDIKGKGKESEVDLDGKMFNITNTPDNEPNDTRPASKGSNARLERTGTIMPDSPRGGESLFGPVLHLLDGDSRPRRLSNATPPPATSPQQASSPGINRHPTDLDIELVGAEIPSSATPSPMKMPSLKGKENTSRESLAPSPAKVSNEVTKALQDSITSLLGKRPPEDEAVPHKPGKRVRPPPKSKVTSRHDSGESNPPAPSINPTPIGHTLSQFEPHDELNLFEGEGMSYEESMQVRYEDPGERDERERLLSIFESQTVTEEIRGKRSGRKGQLPARRSTRMAGF
ncbi:hypothetical protein FIBSPDRAFT_787042 [Athelia psychrophila]|uniref:BRCT domain-containing protein n=1 Tax=Athelia psychrophila TaxID=1759441 RepID=A0A166L6R3_9AGAM|nr:hypothetical protein FIBSPDRAFT_787042 [Fibularhizoctonia sp. CBS 109695]